MTQLRDPATQTDRTRPGAGPPPPPRTRPRGSHARRSAPRSADVVRIVVRTLGELSITAGMLLLLFVAWQLWWTDVTAGREQSGEVAALQQQWQVDRTPSGAGTTAARTPAPQPLPVEEPAVGAPAVTVPTVRGDAFGILRIPRFGSGYAKPVVAGIGTDDLRRGVGHYPDTAMPGEIGNFAIAGHRTTYGAPFWAIAELAPGDALVVQTALGYYTYRVTATTIVDPSDVAVVAAVPDQPGVVPTSAQITLTSCHPRYSARQRYVVHGLFESFQAAADGPPAALAGA